MNTERNKGIKDARYPVSQQYVIEVIKLNDEYWKDNIDPSDISYVVRHVKPENRKEFLDGLVRENLLLGKESAKPKIEDQVELYIMSKKAGLLDVLNWTDAVSYLVSVAKSKNNRLSVPGSFNKAKQIGNLWEVGASFRDRVLGDFYLSVDSVERIENLNPFELEQQKYSLIPTEKLLQHSYRDDPKRSKHYHEHLVTRTLG